jgi:hypothetical protein
MGATYYERKDRGRKVRKSWVVVVRWQGERETKIVHSEQDAKALVQMIHKQELAGVNVIATIRQARNQQAAAPTIEAAVFPTLREALPAWIATGAHWRDPWRYAESLRLEARDVGVSASVAGWPAARRPDCEPRDSRDDRGRHPTRA